MIPFRRVGKTFSLLTFLFGLGATTPMLLGQTPSGGDSASASQVQNSTSQQQSPPPQPGQLPSNVPPGSPNPVGQEEEKRILGVLPNYRTAEMSAENTPITAKQKMQIALKDSFDYPLIFLGAGYALLYQAEDSHPQFGQGVKGYFRRFGTSYADQVDGNMLTEGIMPVLLREDPRYFRLAQGSIKRRTWYALTRIIVTRTDSGHSSFNFAEFLGNGIDAGIGLSYYSDNRNVRDYTENWGTQLGTDAVSQVLKEFWPDIKRKWKARHSNNH